MGDREREMLDLLAAKPLSLDKSDLMKSCHPVVGL